MVHFSHPLRLLTHLFSAALLLALIAPVTPSATARDRTQPLTETTILVGSELDYPPYALIDKDGNPDGFSVDLIKAVAKEMNLKLKFVTGPWNEMKGKLERGEIDALPLVSYSKAWDTYFDYTQPHTISHALIFFRTGDTLIKSIKDIKDKEVIVMRDDFDEGLITGNQLVKNLFYTDTLDEAFELLASGKHDALIASELVGHYLINKMNLTNITHLPEPIETFGTGFAFAVHQGDGELHNVLDRGLILIKQGGEYDKIYDKWFSQTMRHGSDFEELIDEIIIAGIIVGILIIGGIIWNTTLRRQVSSRTAALAQSEERFRSLIENASDGVFIADFDGRYVDVNNTACNMLGYDRDEIIGKTIFDLIPPEDAKRLIDSKTEMSDGEANISEWNLICKNGSLLPVEISANILPSGQWQALVRDITERKLAEQLLRDSETLFREMGEVMPLAIYVSRGLEQNCEYLNPTFTELFGYTIDDVPNVAQWWPKAYPDKEYSNQIEAEWTEKVKESIITNKPIETMETTVRCKDGSSREVSWGHVTYGERNYAFGLDITERNLSEKNLRESEQRFKDISDAAGEYVWELNMDMIYTHVSKQSVQVKGYTPEELLGHTPMEFMPEEDIKKVASIINNAIKHKEPFTLQHQDITKSGGTLWEEVRGTPFYDDSGQVIGLRGTGLNITERKLSMEKIEKLSQAVIQSGEGVVIADAEGIIEYINPAFSKITGYSEDEVIGKKPSMLKSGNQTPSFYDDMWATLKAGKPWSGKVVNRKKEGTFYPAMLTISPIKDASGQITNFIGLQQSLEDLEALEAQFHQAQKMEAMGTLVSGIAHDFNNILAGITGNAYLAKKKSSDAGAIEKLTNIEHLSYRSAELIKQLLTFARKGVVDMHPLPLTSFIKETLKLLRTSIPENIDIQHNICNESLIINGDATQLHQVLMNLVNNAHDAVEGVENAFINIKLESITVKDASFKKHLNMVPGDYAYLSIEDNGCGIDNSHLEHLFEPFFTTKAQDKGTGLGLAMTYGAIKSHAGYIEAQSIKGKGSAFHVYIPLLNVQQNPTINQTTQTPVKGKGELILLVDDEQSVINANKEVLESLNYHIIAAYNGIDAVDKFTANKDNISLVISDVVMPKLSGPEAFERMKDIKPDIKVIFVTGYDHAASSDKNSTLGRHLVINKPFNVIELSHSIRTVLDS